MRSSRASAAILAATFALGGCTMMDGFGYGGLSLGYAEGYYDNGYDPYYDLGYYGWYEGFYYPGTGYYVYDRDGDRHRWNDRHRHYWEGRRGRHQAKTNWSGYRNGGASEGRRNGSSDGARGDWRRDPSGDARPGMASRDQAQDGRGGSRGGDVRRVHPNARPDRAQGERSGMTSRPAPQGQPQAPVRAERAVSQPAATRQQVQRAEPTNTSVRED